MEKLKFDVKKCLESKKILNKNLISRQIYRNECSWSKYLGNCTNLYYKLQPTSYLDFYEKVLKYAEENKDKLKIEDRGLTYQEYLQLSNKYKKLVEEKTSLKYDLETYFYGLVCHSIIETFVGQKKEQQVMDLLKLRGYNAEKIEGKKDAEYHIDISTENIIGDFYIQIKPISFFITNYQDTEEDRIAHILARERLLKEEKIDTLYMVYAISWENSRIEWLSKEDGSILLNIKDLFEYDENDVKNTAKRKPLNDKKLIQLYE